MTEIDFNRPLNAEQTQALIDSFLNDQNISDEIIREYLEATAIRALSYQEIIGAVKSLRSHMLKLKFSKPIKILDTAGTGGSGLHTFNTSTASAFVCAAGGQAVAKHGNRAASSLCGSADVIEALGIRLDLSPDKLVECLEKTNFCFMFAPFHHASTKRVAKIRKEIGKRTIFNFLGPLSNPAQAVFQVIGVSDPRMLEIIANALPSLNTEHAFVVRGDEGLDEISICSSTEVYEVSLGKISHYQIKPEDFGFSRANLEQVKGEDAITSAKILKTVLAGENSQYSNLVALNAGAGLYVSGKAKDLKAGVELACKILKSGAALKVLNSVTELSK